MINYLNYYKHVFNLMLSIINKIIKDENLPIVLHQCLQELFLFLSISCCAKKSSFKVLFAI